MRKILLLSNGQSLSKTAADFAMFLGQGKDCHIKALFFPEHAEGSFLPADAEETVLTKAQVATSPVLKEFETLAIAKGCRHTAQVLRGDLLGEVIAETKYADLVICDASLSPETALTVVSPFVMNVLSQSKCPVLIAPVKFDALEEIAFAYDGSDLSMYAIKLFTYLFPEFNEVPVSVLQVLKDEKDSLTERKKLVELMMLHYNSLSYDHLEGDDVETALFRQFVGKRNIMLVMGAYGRKKLLTDHSTADILLRNIDVPIFIAHY